jgi:AcrR family transcriptional regulator
LFGIVRRRTEAVLKELIGDRRVRKTRRLLRDALVSLIHEKDYDAIAVREILNRANVGRSAFYAHFEDKHALLGSGIRHMLRATPPRQLPATLQRFEKILWFSLPVFEYIRPFRDAGHRGMPARGRALVHRHLRRVLYEEIKDDVAALMRDGEAARLPPDLVVDYVVDTFLLVLKWWVHSGNRLSAREADDVFLWLVLPGLAGERGMPRNLEPERTPPGY